MAITYPLNAPTHAISNVDIRAVLSQAVSESPYTYQQQVQSWGGERWEIDLTTTPMNRPAAALWQTFLLSLKGSEGTFLMGDPRAPNPQGSARNYDGGTAVITTVIDSGSTDLQEIHLKVVFGTLPGPPVPLTNFLMAGDYIQVGTASASTIHQLITPTEPLELSSTLTYLTDALLWPKLNVRPAIGTAVTFIRPRGLWRLNSPQQEWANDSNGKWTLSFGAVQVIK